MYQLKSEAVILNLFFQKSYCTSVNQAKYLTYRYFRLYA